jgi:hypothetical protein
VPQLSSLPKLLLSFEAIPLRRKQIASFRVHLGCAVASHSLEKGNPCGAKDRFPPARE